jgi:RimJ/RimL family protein N-acetyltransferase
MGPGETVIADFGVALRTWDGQRDQAELIRVFDDDEIAYRTPIVRGFGQAEAEEYLRRSADVGRLRLAICSDEGAVVGEIMLNLSTDSFSYVVSCANRGRGFASRAVDLMCRHAATLGIHKVWLEIEPDNAASIAVALRCGFAPADQEPEAVEDKGRTYVLEKWNRLIGAPASNQPSG